VVSRLRQGVVHPEGRIEVGGGRETCVATSRTRVSGVLESGSQRRKLPRFSRRRTPWCVLSAAETEDRRPCIVRASQPSRGQHRFIRGDVLPGRASTVD
jgi:hypothetical protein